MKLSKDVLTAGGLGIIIGWFGARRLQELAYELHVPRPDWEKEWDHGYAKEKRGVVNVDKQIKQGLMRRIGGKICRHEDIQIVDGIEYCAVPYDIHGAPDKPVQYPHFPSREVPSKTLYPVDHPPGPNMPSPQSVKNISYKPEMRLTVV